MTQLHVFNSRGDLVGPVEIEPCSLSDEEWSKRLTPSQFRILRRQGTEPPFCGTLLDNKRAGVYVCAGCRLPLFASDAKFHSGTGWPSFFRAIGPGNVAEQSDRAHGMVRTEIVCARCGGHLGHVFPDGPPPTGKRYCLNSESLFFTPEDRLADLADPAAPTPASLDTPAGEAGLPAQAIESAVVAGGCFWCTEAAFEQLDGVIDVESGYCGGSSATANYRSVCGGQTGHAEAVWIRYDPSKITYEQLLDVFFDAHDPTQRNRQGADVGSQYRSTIFYADEVQKQAAQAKIDALQQARRVSRPIVTTLEPLTRFYPAEAYHQDYARNNPDQPYIQFQAIPKACKIRERYPELIGSQKQPRT